MSTRIFVSGYDDAGRRVATALEQEWCWTFNEVDGEQLQELSDLHAVIDRMRACGAMMILACPDSELAFVHRVALHLCRAIELN